MPAYGPQPLYLLRKPVAPRYVLPGIFPAAIVNDNPDVVSLSHKSLVRVASCDYDQLALVVSVQSNPDASPIGHHVNAPEVCDEIPMGLRTVYTNADFEIVHASCLHACFRFRLPTLEQPLALFLDLADRGASGPLT